MVRFVLAHRDGLVRDHDAIVAAWQDRDLARIAALNAAPGRAHPEIAPHIAELVRHLVEDRSVQMAHRLFLPLRGGRVFVAVGALHLYGDRSLLALLRAQGYRVRRVHRGRRRAMAAGTWSLSVKRSRDAILQNPWGTGSLGRWRKMTFSRRTCIRAPSTP